VRQFLRLTPAVLFPRAPGDYPLVHLFDEPQFSLQDGYIGFMLRFFKKLRAEGRLVFVCLHPNELFHLDILREICERFIFVNQGRLSEAESFPALLADERVRGYLGHLVDHTPPTTAG
jgi:ABC-type histidine transport system ATPase subunit